MQSDIRHETAKDPRVHKALRELTDLARWINDRYRIQLPTDRRARMANGCFDAALEFQAAIQLLATHELYGSMLALVRVLFEAFIRGSWLARCATDEQLEHFLAHDDIPKTFDTLVVEVECAIGNQLGTLLALKRNAWGMMNSFTHTGMLQIACRNSEGTTGANYTADDVETALRLAGVLGLLSAIEMATTAGNEALALETLERANQFAAR